MLKYFISLKYIILILFYLDYNYFLREHLQLIVQQVTKIKFNSQIYQFVKLQKKNVLFKLVVIHFSPYLIHLVLTFYWHIKCLSIKL